MLFDCKMVINKLNIRNNKLNLTVAISCPFDPDVISPKAKIIFECGGKTRRLPFRITNYYRQPQIGSCVTVCSYSFLIDRLFYNLETDSDIKVRIDFYYGENEVVAVPFTVSTSVINRNLPHELDNEYIEHESLVDAASSSSDDEPGILDIADDYIFDFDFENSRIMISKSKESKKGKSFIKTSKIIVPALRAVFLVFRIIPALFLSPLFIIDGFLAGLGILPKRRTSAAANLKERIANQIRLNFSSFIKIGLKKTDLLRYIKKPIVAICNQRYKQLCKKDVVPNRITFMSGRRDELSGNLKFVYDLIKDRDDIDFQFLLFSDLNGHNKIKNLRKFLRLYASSKIVVIDDYFRLLNTVDKRSEVKVFQLWHACGAFKTFGFTRLGKKGGPKQTDPNHRMYDYAIVSSQKIAKHYAEGFGLSDDCIIATGIPRTDIFMDSDYAAEVRARFYDKYPKLRDKKILLFAPTFRGNGQMSAHYPTEAFHPKELYEATGGQYAILIKLHPFCKERFEIPEELSDFIIDMSDEDELNDLLFVTDLLVTDYSSVIFEASLLDIPMLFYSFDLDEYVSVRDFYYDYRSFVPGKIVYNEYELARAVLNGDFELNKVNAFRDEFFDNVDGLSSQRVADFIINAMQDRLT